MTNQVTLLTIAEALGISRATAERDWQVARAWLFDRLSGRSRRDA